MKIISKSYRVGNITVLVISIRLIYLTFSNIKAINIFKIISQQYGTLAY